MGSTAFDKKLQAFRQSHTPEECSCAENEAEHGGNPRIFDTATIKNQAKEMARATKVGCTEYIWRTAMDGGVCPRCAANADKVFRYDRPPPGGHPGMVPGCRCYSEPIIPGIGRGAKRGAKANAKPRATRFAKIFWLIFGLVVLVLVAGKK